MSGIDTVWQPEQQQQVFRCLMNAYAYPGRLQNLSDMITAGTPAYLAVLATLLDNTTTLSDQTQQLEQHNHLLLQAQPASSEAADYILCSGSEVVNFTPKLGTLTDPEQSATLIIRVSQLGDGEQCLQLTGAGIADKHSLVLSGLHPDWISQRQQWCDAFPLGVDMILCDDQSLLALPRTTKIEVMA